MRRIGWLLGLGLVACTAKSGAAGESCTRSTQCESGLACIESRCSSDLGAIEEPGEVPMLFEDAAVDPELDGG